jgi:hypothetical protein
MGHLSLLSDEVGRRVDSVFVCFLLLLYRSSSFLVVIGFQVNLVFLKLHFMSRTLIPGVRGPHALNRLIRADHLLRAMIHSFSTN